MHFSLSIFAGNEPGKHVGMYIWRLPRGADAPLGRIRIDALPLTVETLTY